MENKCYFCQGGEAENYIIINEKLRKDAYICKKCNYESKKTCKVCNYLNLQNDILTIKDKGSMCKNCYIEQQPICSECNVYSICLCSCSKYYCQKCSVKHFLRDIRDLTHYFIGVLGPYYLPDFSIIDEHIKGFIYNESIPFNPDLKSMKDFYQYLITSYHSKVSSGFTNPKYLEHYSFIIGLVYVVSGFLILGQQILESTTVLLKSEDYYRLISVFCSKEFVQKEFQSSVCTFNDKILEDLIKKSKEPRLKKIRLSKSLNLCDLKTPQDLYNSLAYFKVLNIKKHIGIFVNSVHIQFQGIIALPILYKIRGKKLKSFDDANKALVLSNQIWSMSSNIIYRYMFSYSRHFKSDRKRYKTILLKVIQLSISSYDEKYSIKAYNEMNNSLKLS